MVEEGVAKEEVGAAPAVEVVPAVAVQAEGDHRRVLQGMFNLVFRRVATVVRVGGKSRAHLLWLKRARKGGDAAPKQKL